jgi:hypothetical protein
LNPIQAHYQAVLRPDEEGGQNQRLEPFWQASFVEKGRAEIPMNADILVSELRVAFRRIRATCGNQNNGEYAVPETDKN